MDMDQQTTIEVHEIINHLCAFLNGKNGGRIVLGVGDDDVVKGFYLSRKE